METQKSKILMIGAGKEQLPHLEAFLQRGYSVIAVDRNPHAPGFKMADISLQTSTHDSPSVMKAIANLPEKNRIAGIACPSTGMPYITAADCASMLNLSYPSKATVLTLLDKHKLWRVLQKHRMTKRQCLALKELEDYAEHIDLPVVLKPQLAGGGHRGVSFCESKKHLSEAFERAVAHSANRVALAESFCKGKEYKVCGIIQANKIKFCHTALRTFGANKVSGVPIGLSVGPSKNAWVNDLNQSFATHIQKFCSLIRLRDAPLNVDIILTSDGPEIIDFDIVLGSFARLVNNSTGIDMFAACADLCLGSELDLNYQCYQGAAVTHLWFVGNDIPVETFKSVCQDAGGKNIYENRLPNYERITTDTAMCGGCLFSEGQNQEEALERGRIWLKRIQKEMDRLYPNRFNLIMPN